MVILFLNPQPVFSSVCVTDEKLFLYLQFVSSVKHSVSEVVKRP